MASISLWIFYAPPCLATFVPYLDSLMMKPVPTPKKEIVNMRGVLLWLIGLPIPVIILLYLFHVI